MSKFYKQCISEKNSYLLPLGRVIQSYFIDSDEKFTGIDIKLK